MDASAGSSTTTPTPRGWERPPGHLQRGGVRRGVMLVVALATLVMFVGCSDESADPVAVAQAKVADKEEALAEAESAAEDAGAALCDASSAYITALDVYGDVLVQTAPTVGDVRNAGQDLVDPRSETVDAADDLTKAREDVARAEEELADAQAELAAAQASAAGTTPTTPEATEASEEPSMTPSVSEASISRVEQAEADFAAAAEGINDQTPLSEAAEQFNSAAVALEMAWLQLFFESGCLDDDQQEQAAGAIHDYTTALQQALTDAGYFDGEIDGIYGPETVEAVEALQKANDLPQTGALDKATEEALRAELAAGAEQDTATTAAVQQTLKLAGYWDDPVDGVWTDELTDALKEFQTDLGVPATGEVDAATIAAFEEAIENAGQTPAPSPSRTSPPSTPASSATPSPTSTSS